MKGLSHLFGLGGSGDAPQAHSPAATAQPLPGTLADPAAATLCAAQAQFVRDLPRALGTMITHAWKAQQRLKPRTPDEEQSPELRRLSRHIDAILDEAKELGISLRDRTGEEFDYGLPERVVASEPQPGLSRPVVQETIRPTVIWHNQILVHGEVVLATPLDSEPCAAAPAADSATYPAADTLTRAAPSLS